MLKIKIDDILYHIIQIFDDIYEIEINIIEWIGKNNINIIFLTGLYIIYNEFIYSNQPIKTIILGKNL